MLIIKYVLKIINIKNTIIKKLYSPNLSINIFEDIKTIAAIILDTKLFTAIKLPRLSIVTNLWSLLICKIVNTSCIPITAQININNNITVTIFVNDSILKIQIKTRI